MTTPPKTKVRLRLWLAGASLVLAMAGGAVLPAAASASATIYYVGKSSAQTGSGASSMVLSTPANAAVGDVMIMGIDADTTTSFSAPSGWSTSGLYAGGLYFNGWCCFAGYSVEAYKVVTSGDLGASYTVNLAATRRAVGVILDYTGTSGSPIETSATNYATSTTLPYPSVSTSSNGSMILFGGSVTDSSGTPTMGSPTIATRRSPSYATTGTTPIIVSDWSDWLQSTAGATGTQNGSNSSGSDTSGEITIALAPAASGSLQFATAPAMSTLPTLTLNGQAQTLQTKLNNFSVDDTTGTGSGWNMTVQGNSQFAEYCPTATCGSHTGPGYIAGGYTLPTSSFTLNTTGGSFSTTGGSGSAPTFQCNSGCTLDTGSAVKVVSAASGAAKGPWASSGLSATGLSLTAPTTVHSLQTGEVYRDDFTWTLASGP